MPNNTQAKEKAYIIMACISLAMYLFGHSTEAGTLPFPDKLFYIPCALTLAIAVTCKRYWSFDKSDILFLLFLFLTTLSSITIGNVIWIHLVACILAFFIFRHLRKVDISFLTSVLLFLTPVVVFLHYILTNPFSYYGGQRYAGFQGDPNCFSMAMNILVYASGYILLYSTKTIKRLLAYLNIASIAPLIFAGASRSGVLCFFVLVGVSIFSVIKKRSWKSIIVLLLMLIFGGSYFSVFNNQINNTLNRFSNRSDSDRQSSDYRFQEFEIAWNLLTNNPEYLPLGIGFSQTSNARKNFPHQYYHGGRAHNTYMSVLMEQGVIGFLLFIYFLYIIGISVWRKRTYENGWMRVSMFVALLLFTFTIFTLPFLPFWFALYLCQNYN